MAKIIRKGTVFYRSKRFLALYGDKNLTLNVSDMDENIKYLIQCDNKQEQKTLFQFEDADWLEWLRANNK